MQYNDFFFLFLIKTDEMYAIFIIYPTTVPKSDGPRNYNKNVEFLSFNFRLSTQERATLMRYCALCVQTTQRHLSTYK